MPKRDKDATAAKNFQEDGSFVFKDGREWLVGKDWDARRFELLKRCHGQCEALIVSVDPFNGQKFHARCPREAEHPHHVIKKSIAHDDRLDNLKGLCWLHHKEEHPEKQIQKLTKGLTEAQILGLEPRQ